MVQCRTDCHYCIQLRRTQMMVESLIKFRMEACLAWNTLLILVLFVLGFPQLRFVQPQHWQIYSHKIKKFSWYLLTYIWQRIENISLFYINLLSLTVILYINSIVSTRVKASTARIYFDFNLNNHLTLLRSCTFISLI